MSSYSVASFSTVAASLTSLWRHCFASLGAGSDELSHLADVAASLLSLCCSRVSDVDLRVLSHLLAVFTAVAVSLPSLLLAGDRSLPTLLPPSSFWTPISSLVEFLFEARRICPSPLRFRLPRPSMLPRRLAVCRPDEQEFFFDFELVFLHPCGGSGRGRGARRTRAARRSSTHPSSEVSMANVIDDPVDTDLLGGLHESEGPAASDPEDDPAHLFSREDMRRMRSPAREANPDSADPAPDSTGPAPGPTATARGSTAHTPGFASGPASTSSVPSPHLSPFTGPFSFISQPSHPKLDNWTAGDKRGAYGFLEGFNLQYGSKPVDERIRAFKMHILNDPPLLRKVNARLPQGQNYTEEDWNSVQNVFLFPSGVQSARNTLRDEFHNLQQGEGETLADYQVRIFQLRARLLGLPTGRHGTITEGDFVARAIRGINDEIPNLRRTLQYKDDTVGLTLEQLDRELTIHHDIDVSERRLTSSSRLNKRRKPQARAEDSLQYSAHRDQRQLARRHGTQTQAMAKPQYNMAAQPVSMVSELQSRGGLPDSEVQERTNEHRVSTSIKRTFSKPGPDDGHRYEDEHKDEDNYPPAPPPPPQQPVKAPRRSARQRAASSRGKPLARNKYVDDEAAAPALSREHEEESTDSSDSSDNEPLDAKATRRKRLRKGPHKHKRYREDFMEGLFNRLGDRLESSFARSGSSRPIAPQQHYQQPLPQYYQAPVSGQEFLLPHLPPASASSQIKQEPTPYGHSSSAYRQAVLPSQLTTSRATCSACNSSSPACRCVYPYPLSGE